MDNDINTDTLGELVGDFSATVNTRAVGSHVKKRELLQFKPMTMGIIHIKRVLETTKDHTI